MGAIDLLTEDEEWEIGGWESSGWGCFLWGRRGAQNLNLVKDPEFREHSADGRTLVEYQLSGDVEYRYLGDKNRDSSGWGVAMQSRRSGGSVSQTVMGINSTAGRWFRFTFRGLPQDGFAVSNDDLSMRVEFFGDGGRTAFDGKNKSIYPQIEQDRRDFTANGDNHVGGAAVWRTHQLDFWLPFPQVDTVRLSVEFGHGAARRADSEFFISDFSLTRLEDLPAGGMADSERTTDLYPKGTLIPLGGRWYYEANAGETSAAAAIQPGERGSAAVSRCEMASAVCGEYVDVVARGG